jgi:hypothetical protein
MHYQVLLSRENVWEATAAKIFNVWFFQLATERQDGR